MGQTGKVLVFALVLMMLVAPLALASGRASDGEVGDRDGSRGSWTVQRFIEHRIPARVNFEDSRVNASYHLSVPNSATITAASITLKGEERYSLKGTPEDFGYLGHGNIGYYGQIGKFPPTTSPSNYQNIRIDPQDETMLAMQDASVYTTETPFGANPPNYPYHHFDMMVNKTGMVRLKLDWWGWGYCTGNDTNTHGAEAYVWNYTGLEWFRFGRYEANDTVGTIRHISKELMNPDDFTDGFGHVNILVFGQHDEPQGGGWTDVGSVVTDYVSVTVLVNDVLERPVDPSLAIGAAAPFWSVSGAFTSQVTLGDGSGFKGALQTYVSSIAPAPDDLEVPLTFSVGRATWGEIRVTALSVTIREVDNQPPVFLGAREVTMTEDEDLIKAIDLHEHFDDDWNGPNLTYTVEYAENASAVEAVIHTDGRHVNLLTVADDWAGTLEFRFNATDVWGRSTVSSDFTVTVEQVNDPPVLDDPGDQFVDEDVPFELNLTYYDPDLPYGDVLSFEDDTDLFDIDASTGRIAFTADQEDIGQHLVTVVVRDSDARWQGVTFTVTVTDVNDPPVIEDPGLLSVFEDATLDFNFTVHDEDGDSDFTWLLVGGVGTMKLGRYDGRLTWIPSGDFVGVTNVSVIATDRRGSSDQINVSIEVVNVNDPPELDELRPAQLVEGQPFSYTIAFSDPDLEEDPEEGHTISIEPALFPVLPGGVIAFTPGNEHVGVHVLTVTVTDSAGATDEAEWELTVANVNERPTVEEVEDQFWREDEPVLITVHASDPDVGDVLTFSDTTSIFDIHPRTGEINFTPLQANVGTYTVRIVVTDRDGLYADVYIDVTIQAYNDPPIASIRVVTLEDRLKEGDMLSLAAEVEDDDNDMEDLSFRWTLDGKVVGEESTLVLDDLRPGEHTVSLLVNDGASDASASYTFSVEDVEDPFSWWAIVAVVIVVVVAVLGYKAFRAVQDPGAARSERLRETVREPEPVEVEDEGAFEDWSGR